MSDEFDLDRVHRLAFAADNRLASARQEIARIDLQVTELQARRELALRTIHEAEEQSRDLHALLDRMRG